MTKSPQSRILAVFLALALAGQPLLPVWAEPAGMLGELTALSPTRSSLSGGLPQIIHIRDVHANYSVQKKIEALLHELEEKGNIRLVGVEGADVEIDAGRIFLAKDTDTQYETAERFARDGRFTGVELYALKASRSVRIAGLEERGLYRENAEYLRRVVALKDNAETYLEAFQKRLRTLEVRSLALPLQELLKERRAFAADHSRLVQYTHVLDRIASEQGLPVHPTAFPNLVQLLLLEKLDTYVNENRTPLEEEWHAFRADITGGEIASMEDTLPNAAVSKTSYPVLVQYQQFLLLSKDLESRTDDLMHEVDALERGLLKRLAVTHKDALFLQLEDDLSGLTELIHLNLSRERWKTLSPFLGRLTWKRIAKRLAFLERKAGISAPERAVAVPDASAFDDAVHLGGAFYRSAVKRDAAMVNRLVRALRPGERAVLVAGGFHSDGIQEILKERDLSYAVILPEVNEISGRSKYFSSFSLKREVAGDRPADRETLVSAYMTGSLLDGKVILDRLDLLREEVNGLFRAGFSIEEIRNDINKRLHVRSGTSEIKPPISAVDLSIDVDGNVLIGLQASANGQIYHARLNATGEHFFGRSEGENVLDELTDHPYLHGVIGGQELSVFLGFTPEEEPVRDVETSPAISRLPEPAGFGSVVLKGSLVQGSVNVLLGESEKLLAGLPETADTDLSDMVRYARHELGVLKAFATEGFTKEDTTDLSKEVAGFLKEIDSNLPESRFARYLESLKSRRWNTYRNELNRDTDHETYKVRGAISLVNVWMRYVHEALADYAERSEEGIKPVPQLDITRPEEKAITYYLLVETFFGIDLLDADVVGGSEGQAVPPGKSNDLKNALNYLRFGDLEYAGTSLNAFLDKVTALYTGKHGFTPGSGYVPAAKMAVDMLGDMISDFSQQVETLQPSLKILSAAREEGAVGPVFRPFTPRSREFFNKWLGEADRGLLYSLFNAFDRMLSELSQGEYLRAWEEAGLVESLNSWQGAVNGLENPFENEKFPDARTLLGATRFITNDFSSLADDLTAKPATGNLTGFVTELSEELRLVQSELERGFGAAQEIPFDWSSVRLADRHVPVRISRAVLNAVAEAEANPETRTLVDAATRWGNDLLAGEWTLPDVEARQPAALAVEEERAQKAPKVTAPVSPAVQAFNQYGAAPVLAELIPSLLDNVLHSKLAYAMALPLAETSFTGSADASRAVLNPGDLLLLLWSDAGARKLPPIYDELVRTLQPQVIVRNVYLASGTDIAYQAAQIRSAVPRAVSRMIFSSDGESQRISAASEELPKEKINDRFLFDLDTLSAGGVDLSQVHSLLRQLAEVKDENARREIYRRMGLTPDGNRWVVGSQFVAFLEGFFDPARIRAIQASA